ncbi:hypothetical protein GH714_024697 [Hevea brasiliensis]|uniref:Glycoside hydrolase family 31 N-terminal domain-containing protein n=1 Tax=Hevea brasiliensis TaxID=3981 RepID=A0A6A6M5J3_HEVBR|nr:hypothetical protein GH714_024697 [Hevea brasiliensis]
MAGHEEKTVTSDAKSGNMIFEPILEDGVFRFDCSYPSLSFINAKDRDTPIISHPVPSYIPTFECVLGKQIVKLELPNGTSFYGTGEVSGPLERTGKRVFTWNTDSYGYGPETMPLYQSHPWVLAILPNGEALGVLADTTQCCEIDLRKESIIQFIASASYPVITFGPFASPTAVLKSLSHAIGYQQCRWSYDSDKRVREIAETFRKKGIPCDVIWMDIDYMDGFRCFTFDQERFPDPQSLVKDLNDMGFKATWMLDPGIKCEEGYFVYDSGSESDVWVQRADGRPFIGEVWPGPCVFPDFTQSKVRSWWASLVKDFIPNGVDGIWNDMNEPAVFKVFGMLMARSTFEGMKLANENKRPFVLTRAGFIGSQKYAATWTGDNVSNWEHLHMSISMVLQLGLSGQPFSGPDIGGFVGNATPKLFGRWMGVGAMFPFCRGHSEKGSFDHEPWSFGDECEEVCRRALKRRYRLIPHLYTLFYDAHIMGTPVMTPTFFADPTNPSLRTIENSFLLGPLLVYASTIPDQGTDESQHELPNGIWLRFDFDDSHPDLPTLYLQGGSIIPLGPPHQHVGQAKGVLFEDDGDGYEFTKGGYLLTHYVAERRYSVVIVRVSKTEGSWKRPKRRLQVLLLLGEGAMIKAWGMDGESSKHIPDVEEVSGSKGAELSRIAIELKCGDWIVKIVPWIGGRIISMGHLPSGTQWLHSRIEIDGYEEYSGTEYPSAGCYEEYKIIERDFEHAGENESLILEGDIGGGLALQRKISIRKDDPKILHIDSSIIAQKAGLLESTSNLYCLHPMETFVSFTSIDGSKHEIQPESGDRFYEGNLLPNGEWMLVDKCLGIALVNQFNVNEVCKCFIHWGTGTVNLELWSEDRPVSRHSPLIFPINMN